MAHYAEIDKNWVVQRVIVIDNSVLFNENGVECDYLGARFCQELYGQHTTWIQTSYNGNRYKNFAGRGYIFDPDRHCFHPPQPYPSWTLDEGTAQWEPPVPFPNDGLFYDWDEGSCSWIPLPDSQQPKRSHQ